MFDLIYSEHTSDQLFIGKVDPRAKVILFLLYILVVLTIPTNDLLLLLIPGLILIPLLVFSGFPSLKIVKAIIKIYPMILIISFFQMLTMNSGGYLYSGVGFFNLNQESWLLIFGFQLKTVFILTAGLILISSTPMRLFLKSIEKLKMPGWIVTVIFFIYHFIYILLHELTRLQIAYQSRYIKLPIIKRLSIQVKLMAMFLTRVFERNDRLYNALVSRGFNGNISFEGTVYWRITDTMLVLSGITFLILTWTIL